MKQSYKIHYYLQVDWFISRHIRWFF